MSLPPAVPATAAPADGPRDLLDPAQRSATAAALAAGELSADEVASVQQALGNDPAFQRELAWWQSMRGQLPQQGRPAASVPGPGLAAAIRARMQREDEAVRPPVRAAAATAAATVPAERVIRFPAWLGFAVATAAACLVLYLGMTQQQSANASAVQELAYYEDGSAVVLPPAQRAGYMPYTTLNRVEMAKETTDVPPHDVRRPWLGLWTKPTPIVGGQTNHGLVVVRVVEGSPAARAGIQPGDVLISLCDCPMSTRWCIPHALDEHKPGESIELTFQRPGQNPHRVEVVLGASNE